MKIYTTKNLSNEEVRERGGVEGSMRYQTLLLKLKEFHLQCKRLKQGSALIHMQIFPTTL